MKKQNAIPHWNGVCFILLYESDSNDPLAETLKQKNTPLPQNLPQRILV